MLRVMAHRKMKRKEEGDMMKDEEDHLPHTTKKTKKKLSHCDEGTAAPSASDSVEKYQTDLKVQLSSRAQKSH